MEKTKLVELNDKKAVVSLGKALSSEIRLDILALLGERPRIVNEVAEKLNIPPSSAAMHIRVLEEAGLIRTVLQPAAHGTMKICHRETGYVSVDMQRKEAEHKKEEISMPIGNFVNYYAEPTCGIVGIEAHIDVEDEPRCFYNPKRTEARLIWLGNGFLEYRFPNAGMEGKTVKAISFSAELCSEAMNYNMDYPSDITLWINGREIGTWHCPSDYGGRRGRFSPGWWPDKNTQYGKLKKWMINAEGSSLDGKKTEDTTVHDLALEEKPYIDLKIGIKETAENKGGMNLFGKGFGDFDQDIILTLEYE